MLTLKAVARRLVTGDLHYAVARVWFARRLYSMARGALDHDKIRTSLTPTIFPRASVEEALAALATDSFAMGFDLPPAICEGLTLLRPGQACWREFSARHLGEISLV